MFQIRQNCKSAYKKQACLFVFINSIGSIANNDKYVIVSGECMSTLMMKMQNAQHHIYDCTIHNTNGSPMTQVHINHARTSNELSAGNISANHLPMVSQVNINDACASNELTTGTISAYHFPIVSKKGISIMYAAAMNCLHTPPMHLMYFPLYVPPYHPAYSVIKCRYTGSKCSINSATIVTRLIGDHHDEKKEDDNTTINIINKIETCLH